MCDPNHQLGLRAARRGAANLHEWGDLMDRRTDGNLGLPPSGDSRLAGIRLDVVTAYRTESAAQVERRAGVEDWSARDSGAAELQSRGARPRMTPAATRDACVQAGWSVAVNTFVIAVARRTQVADSCASCRRPAAVRR